MALKDWKKHKSLKYRKVWIKENQQLIIDAYGSTIPSYDNPNSPWKTKFWICSVIVMPLNSYYPRPIDTSFDGDTQDIAFKKGLKFAKAYMRKH